MKVLLVFDDPDEARAYLDEFPEKALALDELRYALRAKYKHSDAKETTWQEVWDIVCDTCEGL